MVDQLRSFASEVTRVAREVGTDGRLGGQAVVPGRGRNVEGPHRLGQRDGDEPDRSGPQHRDRNDRRGPRRSVAQDHRGRKGRDSGAQRNHQHDGGSAQRLFVRSDARGARSGHRGQARRPSRRARCGGNVEGPHRLGELDGIEPHRAGSQHRRRSNGDRERRPLFEDHRRGQGRNPRAEEHHEHDGRSAERLRIGSDPRRARSRHGGQTRRPGAGAWCCRNLEGSHRQRELHGLQPHRPGPQHRRSHNGRRQWRPVQEDHGGCEGRNPRAEKHHQHDGRSAQRLRIGSDPRCARGRHRRQTGRTGRGARRRRAPGRISPTR